MIRPAIRHTIATAVIGSLFASLAVAQHSDVEVFVENGALQFAERVAEGEFGSELNPANATDDPGFTPEGAEDTPPTTTFSGGEIFTFETVNLGSSGLNFWHWDGVGSPNFGASPHDLTISRTGAGSINLSEGNGGFTAFAADGNGFFDDHLDFELDSATPDAGVYVFGLTLSSAGLETSDPVFFVMASQGLDEVIHEAGIDYVSANLVPEPSSFGLMLMAVGFFGLRRRR